MFLYFAFACVCMCVAIYFVYVCICVCMYVILCIIGGAPSTGSAFCVTPVMYMWLKLIIIIINQVLRIIQIAVKSDVKTGRI